MLPDANRKSRFAFPKLSVHGEERVITLALVCGSILLNIILLATYLQPLNGLWSGDQGIKLIQVQNLLLNKFTTTAIGYPGAPIDPNGAASPLRGQYYQYNGRTFAMFSDAFAVLSSIPFFLIGFPGLYLIPTLAMAASLVVIYHLARRLLTPLWALSVVLTCAIATPIGFYGLVFWEHELATLFVLVALWCVIFATERGSVWPLILAGVALGCGPWIRNETILAIVALGLAMLGLRPRSIWASWFALGAGTIVILVPLLLYYQLTFGTPLGPHVMNHVVAFEQAGAVQTLTPQVYMQTRAHWGNMLVIPLGRPVILAGLLVLLAVAALGLCTRLREDRSQHRWRMSVALGAIVAICIDIQTIQQLPTSLLVTCPIVLIALLPFGLQPSVPNAGVSAALVQQVRVVRFLLIFAITYILLCWFAPLPDGGAQWGPRLLLPAIPVLVLVAAWRSMKWLQYTRGTLLQSGLIIVLGLVVNIGFLAYIGGLSQIHESHGNSHRILTTVAQSRERVVITDVEYAPALLAQLYFDGHLIYRIDTGQEFDILVTQLTKAGYKEFYYLGTHAEEVREASKVWNGLTRIGFGGTSTLPLSWRNISLDTIEQDAIGR